MSNYLGVFGHVNLDYIISLPKFPEPNTSIELTSQKRFFGGTGANIARMSSSLGVKTALASFVGEDFPPDFRNAMESSGIDLTDLVKVEGYTTPTCWIMTDPKQDQMAVMDQGPMKDMGNFEVLNHTVESCDIIHIGTGRPEYYKRVMSRAKELGKKIAFDPAQEIHYVYNAEIFRGMLELADMLFVNNSEKNRALEYLRLNETNELLDHVNTLIVTKGADGSEILTKEKAYHVPAISPSEVVDPTGAGDAYRGGFYAGLSRSLDLKTCGLLGASAASFAMESFGPQGRQPSWNEVNNRMERAMGE